MNADEASATDTQADGKSFRSIVRVTSMLGSASIVNIAASVLRTKMAALALGPVGIGLIGLFQNLLGTGAAVASFGIGTVGTRQIAEATATDDRVELLQASQALFWGTLALATLGGLVFFALRDPLAYLLTGDRRQADTVGWLAIALMATVLTGSQAALLTGLRRLRALATNGVATAILSIAAAGAALYLAPQRWVLIAYLVGTPIIALLVGQWVVVRQWPVKPTRVPWAILRRHWAGMARIGFWFTAAGLVSAMLMLGSRAVLNRVLGPAALGQFQAAFAISSMYLMVVLQAMGSDYYPRLTAIIADPVETNRTVNAQTEALLLMASPLIFAVLAGAPIAVHLLYSSKFAAAAWILRWQVLGDIFKLAAWPMSFVLLASGSGRRFFLADASAPVVLMAFLWIAAPRLGIVASGVAFLVMYGVYLPVVFALMRQRSQFRWSRRVVSLLATTLAGGLLILAASTISEMLAIVVGTLAAVAAAIQLVARLADDPGGAGPLQRIGGRIRAWRAR